MGKGFNNYMCKKFFHPASRDNLKRVWMAEQKAESYKKKQEELRVQYEKEQDLYTNKAMLSKESKDKLSVNFMYEPPPGTKKEREREDDEPEYKFEWQRKFNAPREDYCKGDSEIRDQPFGIQVRNVRCIKCHKWGHINTDKECPMYNQSSTTDQSGGSMDPLLLVQQMREDGLAMKQSALGLHLAVSEHLPESDEDDGKLKESEIELLKSLSKKQKQKLLKKFKKLEKSAKKEKKRKKGNKESKHEYRKSFNSGESSSDDKKKHGSKCKKKEKDELRKDKVIKHEKYSSSSDSDSKFRYCSKDDKRKVNGKLKMEVKEEFRSGVNHHGKRRQEDEKEEFRRKKIKLERCSSLSNSSSEAEYQKKEQLQFHSREKHSRYDSRADVERKISERYISGGAKYHKGYDNGESHNDNKKRRVSGNIDVRDLKTSRSSEFNNGRKRQPSDSSDGGEYKSKMSRLDSGNNKHKKSLDERPYKRSFYGKNSNKQI